SYQSSTPAQGYGLNAGLRGQAGPFGWEAGADARLARGVEFERFRFQGGQFTRLRKAGGETSGAGGHLQGDWNDAPWLITAGARVDAWRNGRATRIEQDAATRALTLDSHPAGGDGVMPTARAGARFRVAPALWLG